MRRLLLIAATLLLPLMMQAGIVKGKVTCGKKPVAGVQVSDGRQIVLTDAKGRYTLKTDKADSIVFITTPSGYKASMIDPIRPGFWQLLTEAPSKTEVHDFKLVPQDQSSYSVIFITDTHFAADPSRNDLKRFKSTVMPVIRSECKAAAAKGAVYSVNLGDFSHDRYWYDFGMNEYAAERFLDMAGYPTPVYSVSGNHDNDGAVASRGSRTDFESAWNYRHTWGPACYSVNIGSDHWIFMDSVEYINDGEPDTRHKNINGKRNYKCRFLEQYIEWLKKDLAYVPTDTRIFLCCHVPLFNDASTSEVMMPGQAEILDQVFTDFPKVYVFSGHTHKYIHTSTGNFPRFKQFIFGATSGSMWQHPVGYQAIGTDSSEQAINVLDCSESDPSPRYVPISGNPEMMRVYDMNAVGDFYRNDEGCRIFHKLYPGRSWYADPAFDNMIYVNYWDYAPGQKVEIFEDGKPLAVKQSALDEPLYVITYVTPGLTEASTPSKSAMKDRKTPHSFVATASTATLPILVRVSDPQGKVLYEQTVVRPKKFDKLTK
ncbi:MAG: calcineurin-like phosphoesterase C-terminal domain-containing protein [Bacteroidales bacterium]|nr:calcineurin-like phosphoesterase C-terminal domain-containing protein [Bacteroidales bacterium]